MGGAYLNMGFKNSVIKSRQVTLRHEQTRVTEIRQLHLACIRIELWFGTLKA